MIRVEVGDCLDVLRNLPECFRVQCCVTSPPYFGLRDYGHAGQIGLESTPDEYVAKLVEVFRAVRDRLADDGTLWLNLGDSYNAQPGQRKSTDKAGDKQVTNIGANGIGSRSVDGMKPKDLLGIPWRVAFALQQPYYTGQIRDERDRIWLAAMLDAEGCLFIHKRKAGQHNGQGYYRQNDNYGPGVEICNTSLAIVERIAALVGRGSISTSEKGRHGRKQTLYRWNLRTTESCEFVRELYPYLVAKQHQARILYGCPPSGERAEAAHAALIGLHNGAETDVDFPAPRPMFEPGYYLRSDVIWSKSNPMPESVTDRPTKAHEYLFLLSKSAKYHYDAAAIAEEAKGWNGSTFDGPRDLEVRPSTGRGPRKNEELGKRTYAGFNDRWDATESQSGAPETRNRRTVWTVPTSPYSGAHFATFPPALIEPCILAGCPEGGTVLDPFGGAGTTGLVADRLQRNALLIELNPEYAQMARDRITGDAPLFAVVA